MKTLFIAFFLVISFVTSAHAQVPDSVAALKSAQKLIGHSNPTSSPRAKLYPMQFVKKAGRWSLPRAAETQMVTIQHDHIGRHTISMSAVTGRTEWYQLYFTVDKAGRLTGRAAGDRNREGTVTGSWRGNELVLTISINKEQSLTGTGKVIIFHPYGDEKQMAFAADSFSMARGKKKPSTFTLSISELVQH